MKKAVFGDRCKTIYVFIANYQKERAFAFVFVHIHVGVSIHTLGGGEQCVTQSLSQMEARCEAGPPFFCLFRFEYKAETYYIICVFLACNLSRTGKRTFLNSCIIAMH